MKTITEHTPAPSGEQYPTLMGDYVNTSGRDIHCDICGRAIHPGGILWYDGCDVIACRACYHQDEARERASTPAPGTSTPASNEDGERNPESALAELRADTQRIIEEMHQHPDDCGCPGCSGDPSAEQEEEDEYNQHLKPDQR